MNKLFICIKRIVNREITSYLIFGILTTIIDAVTFFISNKIINIDYIISTIIAWIVAVLFAYITNKIWVFKSNIIEFSIIIKEAITFFIARLLSLLFTLIWMFFTIECLGIDEFFSKLLTNIFVVVMNYFFGKLFVFRNKKY